MFDTLDLLPQTCVGRREFLRIVDVCRDIELELNKDILAHLSNNSGNIFALFMPKTKDAIPIPELVQFIRKNKTIKYLDFSSINISDCHIYLHRQLYDALKESKTICEYLLPNGIPVPEELRAVFKANTEFAIKAAKADAKGQASAEAIVSQSLWTTMWTTTSGAAETTPVDSQSSWEKLWHSRSAAADNAPVKAGQNKNAAAASTAPVPGQKF